MKQPIQFRIVTNGTHFAVQMWRRKPWLFGKYGWQDDAYQYEEQSVAEARMAKLRAAYIPAPWRPLPSNEPVIRAIEDANREEEA